MSTPAFTVGQIVTTHDKNFEPELALGSEEYHHSLVVWTRRRLRV